MLPILTLALAAIAGDPAPDRVTFAEHVAPLLHAQCAECHRPGEAAPFSLLTYEDARKRAGMIADLAADRRMPPWHPDPAGLPLKDSRRLTDAQIDLLRRWADQGAPEGDPARTPPAPEFAEGWALGEPDLVVSMDEAFEVPADGPDVFRCFVLKLDLPEDRWVKAVELRPSAREVVHHALFFLMDRDAARQLDGQDGRPGFERMPFLQLRGGLGGWVLGARPQPLPDDLAMPLPAGTDLVIQTHFHPSGKVRREKATLGLYLTDTPPSRRLRGLQVPPAFGRFHIGTIKAGDPNHVVEASKTLSRAVDLISVGGHAHYLCKSMEATAALPDGRRVLLFGIPGWDFDWQGRYFFEEPVRLPAGTRIDVRITYDNSADNPSNPHNPPVDVRFGQQSTDEMGTVGFGYLLADESNPDIGGMGDHLAMGAGGRGGVFGLGGGLDDLGLDGEGDPAMALFRRVDADGDGRITPDEMAFDQARERFDRFDRDGDGGLDPAEARALAESFRGLPGAGQAAGAILMRLDRDGDGMLSRDEAPERLRPAFDRLDRDGDGLLSADELRPPSPPAGGAAGSLRDRLRRALGREAGETRPEAPAEPKSDAGPRLLDLDGRPVTPLDPGEDEASVLIFVTHDCPIAGAYAPEINRIAADYAGKPVRFTLVHVDPSLTPEAARAHAEEYGYVGRTIVLDADRRLVGAVGASVTPEAAVIRPGGEVAYLGRIDDRYAGLGRRRLVPTTRELRDAIDAVLAGGPVASPRVEAIGCPIPPPPDR